MNIKTQYNLWDTLKAILQGELITLSAYIKIRKRTINGLVMQLKQLEKREQTESKLSRWQEIMRIRAETNKTEKETIQRVNE